MKSAEEIMEILEGFDLTESYRDAAELAGCSPNTVARYVAARQAGMLVPGRAAPRPSVIDGFLPKLEELVERSKGKIRADVAHDKIVAMGFVGSERTTRRAVAQIKKAWRSGRRRVHRPWIAEPGMWAQYDFGDGPRIAGIPTILFCFWLAWCRFRVVVPLLDKSQPSVIAAIDIALRRLDGVPTYLLTDNEKTVTTEHVAGVAVRNAATVALGRHYGLTVATCLPADPATKGGSEACVRVAKADLVPTEANLLEEYASFAELEAACTAFCDQVNARPHRITRRAPAEMLAEEQQRLHPLPAAPLSAAFGVMRTVGSNTPMVSFEVGQYSVPHTLAGQRVWVRRHGEQVVIVHVGERGPVEVARHAVTTPGSPRLDDAHFPPAPPGVLSRTPRPRGGAEAAFLSIGDGAVLWLTEAGAAGATRVRAKMAEAVELARLHGSAVVDRALGQAATAGRFADGDLAAILTHQAQATPGPLNQASEGHTLAQGTAGWAGFGDPEVTS
ncbi:MAG TPA: IS21 family transposase [Pseudonocardiaceae bacterium]|nr:IS21 family transposase [Pseudonocardiaceae bacterium]